MALTIRNVESIREALDLFKSKNSTCIADTKAIDAMVNEYHELKNSINDKNKKIYKLEQEKYDTEYSMNSLTDALAPFVKKIMDDN